MKDGRCIMGDGLSGVWENLTEKQKGVWRLSLNFDFPSFQADICFPKDTIIEKIESKASSPLIEVDDCLYVKVKGRNGPKLEIYYRFKYEEKPNLIPYLSLIPIPFIAYFLGRKMMRELRLKHVWPTLNEKERKIMKVMVKHRKLRWKELRELTGIAKSSLSRNLMNLERKGLVKIERIGRKRIIVSSI